MQLELFHSPEVCLEARRRHDKRVLASYNCFARYEHILLRLGTAPPPAPHLQTSGKAHAWESPGTSHCPGLKAVLSFKQALVNAKVCYLMT